MKALLATVVLVIVIAVSITKLRSYQAAEAAKQARIACDTAFEAIREGEKAWGSSRTCTHRVNQLIDAFKAINEIGEGAAHCDTFFESKVESIGEWVSYVLERSDKYVVTGECSTDDLDRLFLAADDAETSQKWGNMRSPLERVEKEGVPVLLTVAGIKVESAEECEEFLSSRAFQDIEEVVLRDLVLANLGTAPFQLGPLADSSVASGAESLLLEARYELESRIGGVYGTALLPERLVLNFGKAQGPKKSVTVTAKEIENVTVTIGDGGQHKCRSDNAIDLFKAALGEAIPQLVSLASSE